MRPLLGVVLVPSTPMNDDRLATSLSFRIAAASACCRCDMAANEILSGASEMPMITPVSCTGKKPLGTMMYRKMVATRVRDRHQQGNRLVVQDELHRSAVERDGVVESALRCVVEATVLLLVFMTQQQRAHHRRQRQRDDGGQQNRHAQRDREFAEQPAHDVAHEQQRDQARRSATPSTTRW